MCSAIKSLNRGYKGNQRIQTSNYFSFDTELMDFQLNQFENQHTWGQCYQHLQTWGQYY
jgi:hypothetical protein